MSLLTESFFEEDLTTLGSFFSIEFIDPPKEWACNGKSYLWRIYKDTNLDNSKFILASFQKVKTTIDHRGRIRLNQNDLMNTIVSTFSLTGLAKRLISEGRYKINISSVQDEVYYIIELLPDDFYKRLIRKHYDGPINPFLSISLKIL